VEGFQDRSEELPVEDNSKGIGLDVVDTFSAGLSSKVRELHGK